MLFRRKADATDRSFLKPFALKLHDGYLVGWAAKPELASPCASCVERWLRDRNVSAVPATINSIPASGRNLIEKLKTEASPHAFYELLAQGSPTRLECLVFPHPDCNCNTSNYLAPKGFTKNTNLAFSPIFQVKCIRYGTPSGNLWQFNASGYAPTSRTIVTAYGTHPEKEEARALALDAWMKKASLVDLQNRSSKKIEIPYRDFINDKLGFYESNSANNSPFKGVGVGANQEEATLDALFSLAKLKTLNQYTANAKNPMLIVGANTWLRQKVPFFLLQQYDLYLLFYPNSSPAWVVGLAAFSRLSSTEKPTFVFGADANVATALNQCLHRVLEFCRPMDWRRDRSADPSGGPSAHAAKLNLWWTHWIYRCPKISLKDVLQLGAHPRCLDTWRTYLRGKHESASVLTLNYEFMPTRIRHVVKLEVPNLGVTQTNQKINGIGTWANFQDAVTGL